MFDEADESLLCYIAKKIGQRQNDFFNRYTVWKRSDFVENRGRHRLSFELQQLISDEWYLQSIPTVDCRNGRESASIPRSFYAQRFHKDITHK